MQGWFLECLLLACVFIEGNTIPTFFFMCVHVCLGQFWGGVFVLLSSCCFVTLIVGLSMKSVYQICFYDWYGNLELSLYICLISMHMPLGLKLF